MSHAARLLTSVSAVCLLSSIILPAKADPTDVVAAVKEGTLYGGLSSFVVAGADAAKLPFANRKQSNGTYLIDRAADSDQHICMTHANATWVFALSANPNAPVPADAASRTDQALILQCNLAWHRKVKATLSGRKVSLLSAKVAEKDATISAAFYDTLAAIRIESIQYSAGDINAKNAQTLLESQFKDISAKNSALTKEINATQDALDKKKTKELQDDIDASVGVAKLFSKVAFKDDPGTMNRIDTAATGLGNIAGNIVKLAEGGIGTGASILAGVGIANAALSIVSMFGPSGADRTAALIQSGFQSVRKDIADLKGTMLQKFAEVERALQQIDKEMNARFDRLDAQYQTLEQQLLGLSDTVRAQNKITNAALTAILSQPYWQAYFSCTKPGIETLLKGFDYLSGCLTPVAVFGSKEASEGVLNGKLFFDYSSQHPEDEILALQNLDSAYWPGFLHGMVTTATERLKRDQTSDETMVPDFVSPHAWAGIVDTYLSLTELAPKLKTDPISLESLRKFEQDDVDALIRAGQLAISEVAFLRTAGVQTAAALYTQDANELATNIARAAVAALPSQDLGITQAVDYSELKSGMGGRTIYFELRRNGKQLVVSQGPQKGQTVVILSYYRRSTSLTEPDSVDQFTQPAYVAAAVREMAQHLSEGPGPWGIETYDQTPVQTPKEQINSAVSAANGAYINAALVKDYTAQAKTALLASIQKVGNDPGVQAACVRLADARLALVQMATLFRSQLSLDDDWVKALAALPGAPASVDPKDACTDIIGAIAMAQPTTGPSDLAPAFLNNWSASAIEDRLASFVAAYKTAPDPASDVAEVTSRIARLDSFRGPTARPNPPGGLLAATVEKEQNPVFFCTTGFRSDASGLQTHYANCE